MKILIFLCACVLYVHARSPSDLPDIFTSEKPEYKDVRCQVCKAVVTEMDKMVWDVSPTLKLDIGGYRLDTEGNKVQKKVQYKRSEMHMMDVVDEVCKKVENYVRGKVKKTGKTVVFPIIVDGAMNPMMGRINVIQDNDLNKSIEFYCENIVEMFEDEIVKLYGMYEDQMIKRFCVDATQLCPEGEDLEDDYHMDDLEEEEIDNTEFDEPFREVPKEFLNEHGSFDFGDEKDEL